MTLMEAAALTDAREVAWRDQLVAAMRDRLTREERDRLDKWLASKVDNNKVQRLIKSGKWSEIIGLVKETDHNLAVALDLAAPYGLTV